MMKIAIGVAAFAVLPVSQATAWGGVAHEAICEIAFQELNPTARQRVIELVEQDEDFRLFRASCNLADRPSRIRPPEHFVNLPRNAHGLTADDPCPLANECVVTAIEHDAAILGSADASDEEEFRALALLGHWMGDLTQPMHVSFEDDRGGNSIREQGTSCDNLHAVWDRCIVEERLGTDPREIAGKILAETTDEQRAEWLAGGPVEWANEAFAIVTQSDVEYCVQEDGTCAYEQGNTELDEGEPEKSVVVDDDYLDQHAPVVREQIAKAGVRLGAMINEALGDNPS